MFLGVDGGGTKTGYLLIDSSGRIRARHVGPSVSHQIAGFAPATQTLVAGIQATLSAASLKSADVTFAFIGLPCYGEDSATTPDMDAMPRSVLDTARYRCDNDMLCSWAGSLGCSDGVSVIAGTGSIIYGRYAGRDARAGGWSEIIGDEGSAYWIAREGMNLFSRMSDGRRERGPLYELVRSRLGLSVDLDLCAKIYGDNGLARSMFAQFAPLVHDAAEAGDTQARAIFDRGADELVEGVVAVRRALQVPEDKTLAVSHTGGVFTGSRFATESFRRAVEQSEHRLQYRAPLYSPDIGAALYAAQLSSQALSEAALRALDQQSTAA